ncbi:NucA/NucB deoxyribonuclease domain-containing protein [Streptomyces sp. CMB-StM0423]|uniref:NucA/NucB deoxyribonuclease domain-containing protein n=1 Tax=Streptomyces sp. CMB-StM0423 TaxID=2059884 RepID=UPI000C70CBC4|nr:hypothetical protein [Streptomyces sp. CMB-StM0423]AUH40527.1 hypothetical protein CXR04_09935 [Streptomyces sp. CMB-StM0423]
MDNAFTGWWYTRTQQCDISSRVLTFYTDRGPVGTLRFVQYSYTYTDDSLNAWAYQMELSATSAVGDTSNIYVQGAAICNGPCTTTGEGFSSQVLSLTSDATAEMFFDSTISSPGSTGTATTPFTRFFTKTGFPPTTPAAFTPPAETRCDNATPGLSSVGCVFPDYEPVFQVTSAQGNPAFARHLRDALASGLPGAYQQTPLTRLTDTTLSRRNGNTACPQEADGGYPRPAGYSCDEYPFRSSWQGAFTSTAPNPPHPGRTFDWCQIPALGPGSGPNGWSACMIPEGQNSSGGGYLSSFYRNNRVIEKDPFFVWIAPGA